MTVMVQYDSTIYVTLKHIYAEDLGWKDNQMAEQFQTVTCHRCGSGFVLTTTYQNLLSRRGAKVVIPVLCPTCFLNGGPQPKQRGTVKWFSLRKHYGFIVTDEGEEVFFHEQQILEENGNKVRSGHTVQFHLHYPIKGPEALNVELVEE
jgi:cold shock CspA family protein